MPRHHNSFLKTHGITCLAGLFLLLVIKFYYRTEDIGLTIHPHPSLGEAVMDAADVALGFPTNI